MNPQCSFHDKESVLEIIRQHVKPEVFDDVLQRPDSWLDDRTIASVLEDEGGPERVYEYLQRLFSYGGS